MDYQVAVSPSARRDLRDIVRYISLQLHTVHRLTPCAPRIHDPVELIPAQPTQPMGFFFLLRFRARDAGFDFREPDGVF